MTKGESFGKTESPQIVIPDIEPITAIKLEDPTYSVCNICIIVSFYIFVSIATVLTNKAILREFHHPLTLLWLQMLLAVVILHALQAMRVYSPPWSLIFDLGFVKRISPLILINVIALTLNTLCLDAVDVLVYQLTRAMVLPLTLFFGVCLDQSFPNLASCLACLLITSGFLAGTVWDARSELSPANNWKATNLLSKTLLYGLGSSMMVAINAHVIKRCFKVDDMRPMLHPSKLVYINNAFSLLILTPVTIFTEYSTLIILNPTTRQIGYLSVAIFASSILGLLINLAGYLQIKATSPLGHTISASARGVLQTILAWALLNEHLTPPRAVGIAIILLGTAIYTICNST